VNYQLQIRRPHRAYQVLVTSSNLHGLEWGWQQYMDARYFTGSVRIVDVSKGTLKIVRRARVSL